MLGVVGSGIYARYCLKKEEDDAVKPYLLAAYIKCVMCVLLGRGSPISEARVEPLALYLMMHIYKTTLWGDLLSCRCFAALFYKFSLSPA